MGLMAAIDLRVTFTKKTNGNIKEVDLETEIQVKTRKAMVKGLGANKENKVTS